MYKETYQRLTKIYNYYYDDFEKFIKISDEDENQFSELVTEVIRENDIIKFKFINYYFLLESEIHTTKNTILMKTYQIVIDKNDYPKTKLEHVQSSDIIIQGGDVRFTPVTKFVRENVNYDGNSDILLFGKQYIFELYKYIVLMEQLKSNIKTNNI